MITAIGIMVGLFCLDHFWSEFRKEETLGGALWKFILFCIVVLCLIVLIIKDMR